MTPHSTVPAWPKALTGRVGVVRAVFFLSCILLIGSVAEASFLPSSSSQTRRAQSFWHGGGAAFRGRVQEDWTLDRKRHDIPRLLASRIGVDHSIHDKDNHHHREKDPVDMWEVDCAIVGAGPAGLATALGLHKVLPQAKIVVVERAGAFRRVGGQIGFMTVGFQALQALDPKVCTAVQQAAVPRRILRRFDGLTGKVIQEIPFDNPDTAPKVLSWFDLQQSLLHCLSATDDDDQDSFPVDVKLDHELVELTEQDDDDDSIVLQFTNGQSCRARTVIGADGNLSRVRSLLFSSSRADDEPEFAGSCIWRFFVPIPPVSASSSSSLPTYLQTVGELNVWSAHGKILSVQRMQEDRIYVSGQAAWPVENLHLLDRQRYIGEEDGAATGGTTCNDQRWERFLDAFDDFDSEIVQFLRQHCQQATASILEHGIYMRSPGKPWGRGRVTMVGDAAHVMPPNMAMGTPTAMEDAVALAHAIQDNGWTARALRLYETTRQPRVNRIATEAIRQTRAYYLDKNETANPFAMNNPELFHFINDFRQEPLVVSTQKEGVTANGTF